MPAPDPSGLLPDYVRVVRAANPGPLTLEGTNTYVLRVDDGLVVIDPGPALEEHQARVADSGKVRLILLTHWHLDHSEGAQRLNELTGAPIWALDPRLRSGDAARLVVPGEGSELRLELGAEFEAYVMPLPGHTADSVGIRLEHPHEPALITGDTLLGRGPSVVAPPHGQLESYLSSLSAIAARVSVPPLRLLPGHGPVGADSAIAAAAALDHRFERLEQVRQAMSAGAGSAAEVVRIVYADVEPTLLAAAALSVQAQLDYLARGGPGRPER